MEKLRSTLTPILVGFFNLFFTILFLGPFFSFFFYNLCNFDSSRLPRGFYYQKDPVIFFFRASGTVQSVKKIMALDCLIEV